MKLIFSFELTGSTSTPNAAMGIQDFRALERTFEEYSIHSSDDDMSVSAGSVHQPDLMHPGSSNDLATFIKSENMNIMKLKAPRRGTC